LTKGKKVLSFLTATCQELNLCCYWRRRRRWWWWWW